MKPHPKILAATLSVLLFPLAHAEQNASPGTVVVTASRFSESSLGAAANVLVIGREDIAASGAATLPDVLKNVAGVVVRPLYGSIGADTAIDMRGFGDGAGQRTLVLLNGQRLNPLDSGSVDWGLVPLDSIERVEIVSGSGAVLYGDNAVGGVINIITGSRKDGGSVVVGLGSRDGRQLAANLARRVGDFDLALAANHQETDGWRRNNAQERNNANGRLGYRFESGEAFLDMGWSKLEAGLPGVLTQAQYRANPRQAETLDSRAERRAGFVRPGFEWRVSDSLTLAAELTRSETDNESWISNFSSFDNRRTDTVSFTPRLLWKHGLGALASTTTLGVDYYDGELDSRRSSTPSAPVNKIVRIDQISRAVYVQNRTELASSVSLTLGGREQTIDQKATDTAGGRISNDHRQTIGEIGLAYRPVNGLRFFVRGGSTFRFANLDELTTFAGFVSETLRPERGSFIDLGGQWSGASHTLQVTAYDLKMKDEIAFSLLTFENENLAKTRHRGIEANGSVDVNRFWKLSGGVNLQSATFREGSDRGNDIPLVPRVQANAGVHFLPSAEWDIALLAQHIGRRYFGGDTGNVRPRLPAYSIADLVVTWQHARWTARGRVLNLADKRYAPTGYDFGFGSSYYPADGRSFFADLRYSF